jgi:hypothetical protein
MAGATSAQRQITDADRAIATVLRFVVEGARRARARRALGFVAKKHSVTPGWFVRMQSPRSLSGEPVARPGAARASGPPVVRGRAPPLGIEPRMKSREPSGRALPVAE